MSVRIRPPVSHVKHLQETENFFRSVFAFELVDRQASDIDRTTVIHLKEPTADVSVKLLCVNDLGADDSRPEREEDRNITITTDDLVGDVDVLIKRGADFTQLPGGTTSRTRYACLIGPEERTVELIQASGEG